jgi:monothiol glutaredoxin
MSDLASVQRIEAQLKQNPVLLYMKGTPEQPRCGFSAKVVEILERLQVQYTYVDVLENPDIRTELPRYAAWPTFPQLYINGELIGGCDIVSELYADQSLAPRFETIGAVNDQAVPCLARE